MRPEPRVSVSPASSSRPGVAIATGQGAEMKCASADCMLSIEGLLVSNVRKGTEGLFLEVPGGAILGFPTGIFENF